MRAITESPQLLVLSFCGDNTEHCGTTNVVLGGGKGQFIYTCLEKLSIPFLTFFLTILCDQNEKVSNFFTKIIYL